MLYFLWTLINFGLLLSFIAICFKATKLLREKSGALVSLVFVFCLLSFVANSGKQNNAGSRTGSQVKKWVFKTPGEIEQDKLRHYDIVIESNVASDIDLNLVFGKDKFTNNAVAVEASSSLSGLVGGHTWIPENISVSKSLTANTWVYTVTGSLNWKLLGTTIYSQHKLIKGTVETK